MNVKNKTDDHVLQMHHRITFAVVRKKEKFSKEKRLIENAFII